MSDELPLAAEFPPTSQADWRKLVDAALKGESFEKRLTSQTYDGLRVEPLYPRAAGAKPVLGRAPGAPWTLMQRIDHPDPATANAQALQDLQNGATGLALVFAGTPTGRGFGAAADKAETLDQTLSDVMLDLISLRLETAPYAGRPVATLMTAFTERRKLDPAVLAIDFGLDPIGDFARTGASPLPWPDLSARAAGTAKDLQAKGFAKARFLRADGRAVHEAGGSEAQELAFVLATGVAYLRLLEANGFSLDEARRRISFLMAADADEFLTIAKFRSLRKLWARVEQACGLTPKPAYIAAETAWRMMTRRDADVNMLRMTIAVAAAGLGGADNITALPHSAAVGLPDAFARRIARNTQLILLEESNLFRVADPAAGSGAIEDLTAKLDAAAWAQFQEIEAAGGPWPVLERGLIQKNVATARAARQKAVAQRKDAITGTSDYPNLAEKTPAVLDVAPGAAPKPATVTVTAEPLPSIRLAEPFEALRDASDRALKKTGARPKVFLANLGKVADFTARAMFAKNFYEAGGIEAAANDGFLLSSPLPSGERSTAKRSGEGGQSSAKRPNPSPAPSPTAPERPLPMGEVKTDLAAMIAAFKASRAKLACLCSSDKVYAAQAIDGAKALTAAGAIVHLAGRPGELEPVLKQAGIKAFIFMGCDAVSTLQAAHDILGVK